MARMIPETIPDDTPPSEKIIFKNLMHASLSREWVVFHSEYVDNPNHTVRPREIDFLIFTDNFCVICLEVKGGSYEIDRKQWYRLPDRKPVRPSPPDQARTAMFALKEEFKLYFPTDSPLSLGCAVAFTDSNFPEGVRTPKDALIIERSDARNADKLVEKLANYADKLPTSKTKRLLEDKNECMRAWDTKDKLQSELEETVTITQDPKRIFRDDLETLRPQLLRLTTDQLSSLELINNNPRCVIDGAAGTGKTVLAMELARQRCEKEETVALLCSNPYLSSRFDKWTKTFRKNSNGRIVAGTPVTLPFWAFRSDDTLKNKHRERCAKYPGLAESLKRGYRLDRGWPSFIHETVKDLTSGGVFDYLIVDEAQNLCDELFLKLMDGLLKDGLIQGNWTMFGDFENQGIVASRLPEDTDVEDALKGFDKHLYWTNCKLKINCRNTHEIATTVAKLVDIESPPISGVHGPLVEIKYFGDPKGNLEDILDELIRNYKDKGFQSDQIILLSSGIGNEFNTNRSYNGWKLLNMSETTEKSDPQNREGVLIPGASSSGKILRYSDIYDFQGLESELAILVIPVTEDQVTLKENVSLPREKHLNRVLYTGMSRAKTMLVIVADKYWKETLERRVDLYNKLREVESNSP